MARADMQPLLVELGTEELPVKALPALAQAFFDGVIDGLAQRGIAFDRDGAKPLFIAALGAAALERLAFAAHIRAMPRLLGAYGFDGDATGYRQRLSGWLGNAVCEKMLEE